MRSLRRLFAGIAALLMLHGAALADMGTLTLPASLRSVGDEAFAGASGFDTLVLQEGVERIGSMAFADCPTLAWLTVPGSVKEIAEDAISGCAEDLLIRTDAGSAAMTYAQAHDIDYQADTAYRALLIGQTYRYLSGDDYLLAPPNDVSAMAACLANFDDTSFEVTTAPSLTAEGILAAIAETFAGARPQDVSLFYYSGHGAQGDGMQGALVGADWGGVNLSLHPEMLVTVSQLRSALDAVPGRKILIIDACYSGAIIEEASDAADDVSEPSMSPEVALSAGELTAEGFAASFIEGFSAAGGTGGRRRAAKSAGANGSAYFIMTAVASDEVSYEYGYTSETAYSLFTRHLAAGCGYDGATGQSCSSFADVNGNGVVTFLEAFDYTSRSMREEEISQGYTDPSEQQHAQVSPVNCGWYGFLRQ